MNLPKPLAVLHRSSLGPETADVDDDIDHESTGTSPKSWDVVAVVKNKMVFAKRPMPMVGKVAGITSVGVGRKAS